MNCVLVRRTSKLFESIYHFILICLFDCNKMFYGTETKYVRKCGNVYQSNKKKRQKKEKKNNGTVKK